MGKTAVVNNENELPGLDQVKSFEKMAEDLLKAGNIKEAIEQLNIAISIEKIVLGHEHPRFLRSADLLADIYYKAFGESAAAALQVWAFSPAGKEPNPIYNLDPTTNLENLIQLLRQMAQNK